MRSTLRGIVIATGLAFAVSTAACGGSSDGPPKPLSYHFDEMYIAAIALDAKKAVIAAQQQYFVAKMEQAKADSDLKESQVALDIARNERQAAKLDESSAASRKAAAEQSADTNRINNAVREQRGAELAHKAAEERVRYIEAYQGWLKKLQRYTAENTYWREAQYEQAKARLAQANGIAPKDNDFGVYGRQEQERARKATEARSKAEREKQSAQQKRGSWLKLQGEADKLLGRKSTFPDPMAPKPVTPGTPGQGGSGYTLGTGTGSDSGARPAEDATQSGNSGSP